MLDLETHDLHQERLQRVATLLKASGARRVLDLGCGSGRLLQYLMREPQYERVVGLELDGELLAQAKLLLENLPGSRRECLELVCASYTEPHPALSGFEAAAMVETIEHVLPEKLSAVEQAVFGEMRPSLLIMTTPNREYNPLYDMEPGELRDADHKFEWDRARFREWVSGVAWRNGYRVTISGIGDWDPEFGQPTQVARFER
ncbi:methyltransferase domain-containing protein [Halomonas eurihalina]|uniref:Small RNA 2'-O-methyltransferase n=1 Tax=Halomonas eurihalina TaxID=42566 RepID=A0A5D9D709_HALER|nr:methyltransferase domain-containing protein [Halomonas eurihalina]